MRINQLNDDIEVNIIPSAVFNIGINDDIVASIIST